MRRPAALSTSVMRIALVALVAIAACAPGAVGGTVCSDVPCDRLAIDPLVASAPASQILLNSAEARFLSDAPPVGVGNCYAAIKGGDLGIDAVPASTQQFVIVFCEVADRSVTLQANVDLTKLAVGISSLPMAGDVYLPNDAPTCSFAKDAQLEVTVAQGSAVPYPQMVTPDYARVVTLSVKFDVCDVLLDATLQFSVTAAAYHAFPGSTCQECTS